MLVGIPKGDVEGVGSGPLGPPSAVRLYQGAGIFRSDPFHLGDQATPNPDTLNRWVDGQRGNPREPPGFSEAWCQAQGEHAHDLPVELCQQHMIAIGGAERGDALANDRHLGGVTECGQQTTHLQRIGRTRVSNRDRFFLTMAGIVRGHPGPLAGDHSLPDASRPPLKWPALGPLQRNAPNARTRRSGRCAHVRVLRLPLFGRRGETQSCGRSRASRNWTCRDRGPGGLRGRGRSTRGSSCFDLCLTTHRCRYGL